MTPQPNTIQEILDRVSLNPSKGYTKIGLERAIQTLLSTAVREARIDEANWWNNMAYYHDKQSKGIGEVRRECVNRLAQLKEGDTK